MKNQLVEIRVISGQKNNPWNHRKKISANSCNSWTKEFAETVETRKPGTNSGYMHFTKCFTPSRLSDLLIVNRKQVY
jgi:hypothetical protein